MTPFDSFVGRSVLVFAGVGAAVGFAKITHAPTEQIIGFVSGLGSGLVVAAQSIAHRGGNQVTGTVVALNDHVVRLPDRSEPWVRQMPVVRFPLPDGTHYSAELQEIARPEHKVGAAVRLMHRNGDHRNVRLVRTRPLGAVAGASSAATAMAFGIASSGPGFIALAVLIALLMYIGRDALLNPKQRRILGHRRNRRAIAKTDPLSPTSLPDLKGVPLPKRV